MHGVLEQSSKGWGKVADVCDWLLAREAPPALRLSFCWCLLRTYMAAVTLRNFSNRASTSDSWKAGLSGMAFNAADKLDVYAYGLGDITSVRLIIFLAFCSFGIYKYLLKAAKYRVRLRIYLNMPTLRGSTDTLDYRPISKSED